MLKRSFRLLLFCLLLASQSLSTACAQQLCIAPPRRPADAPSDWEEVVHPNCFADIERLGLWVGGTTPLQSKQSPELKFKSVTEGSISGRVTVVVHGWAPGYRGAVDNQNSRIL